MNKIPHSLLFPSVSLNHWLLIWRSVHGVHDVATTSGFTASTAFTVCLQEAFGLSDDNNVSLCVRFMESLLTWEKWQYIPVYKKVLVCPPITTSTPRTFLAIALSVSNPEWPRAMILFTPRVRILSTSRCKASTSSSKRRYGPEATRNKILQKHGLTQDTKWLLVNYWRCILVSILIFMFKSYIQYIKK